jgi:hypothetical protein
MADGGMSGHGGGREILIEFVVQGNVAKATAIDPTSGIEACVMGPANAPRATLADAARRKLEFLMKKKSGGADPPLS